MAPGRSLRHLANLAERRGSTREAGLRSALDAWIDVPTGTLRLDEPDLVRDLFAANDMLTATTDPALRAVIQERLTYSINRRFTGANVVSFFDHNLERLTVKEVLTDQKTWTGRIGSRAWDTIKTAEERGLIRKTHILDPKIFRDSKGKLRDTRLLSKQTLRDLASVFDFFGQGKVLKSLLGSATRIAILPPAKRGGGTRYFIHDTAYVAQRNEQGLQRLFYNPAEAGKQKLRDAADPLKVITAVRQGYAKIVDPEGGGWYARAQRAIGVGTAYATRRPLISRVLIDPIKRAIGLSEGGTGVLAKREYRYPGNALLGASPLADVYPELLIETGKVLKVPGGGELANIKDLKMWDRLKVLFGAHEEFEVLRSGAYKEAKATGRTLYEKDKLIPRPTGGIEQVEQFIPRGVEGATSAFFEETITGAGAMQGGLRAKYHAVPAGFGSTAMDFANYMFYRVGALASSFGLGIGFKPSASLPVNIARLGAIPLIYEAGKETIGYLDYQIEALTGVSPIKAVAGAYAGLRVAQQKLREVTGIRATAGALEDVFPGSVESEIATVARTAALPLAGFAFGLPGGAGRALTYAGILLAALGGPAVSQPSAELAEEYAGERKVPVRRGALWGFGYQPFFGGDVAYYEQSWYHKLQTDYKTKSIYGSREEYYTKYANVFGIPLPTPQSLFGIRQILDPYALEKKHYFDRPYMETAGRFDEFPIVGKILSFLDEQIPLFGKRRKRMHTGELMGIPTVAATLSDRAIPANAARRLGIEDLPAAALVYEDASSMLVRTRELAAIASEPSGIYKFALQFFGVTLEGTSSQC
jgi:hypothetical protein